MKVEKEMRLIIMEIITALSYYKFNGFQLIYSIMYKSRVKLVLLFAISVFMISACDGLTGKESVSREVANLTAFAKLYGHVKYFHPSDEAREIDWDKGSKRCRQ